jgi:hypothetical protein
MTGKTIGVVAQINEETDQLKWPHRYYLLEFCEFKNAWKYYGYSGVKAIRDWLLWGTTVSNSKN